MDEIAIKTLLDRVADINKKYSEIAKITGENFNIFRILKIEANEVRTHSAFIAELLDTCGSHGQRAIFLDIFLDQQKEKQKHQNRFLKRLKNFDSSKSKVSVEQHIGFISEDKTEGGRIDILISDIYHNTNIIIENKIYAGDQPKQLVRYNNAYKNAPIFYLTLNGEQPAVESCEKLQEGDEFICISYKADIKEWLEECIKEAVGYPLLRETIQQYIFLINYLTNQTNSHKMNKEIVDIVLDKPETLDAYFSMCSIKGTVQKKILEILNDQLKIIADQNGLTVSNDINNNSTKNNGFFFSSNELKPLEIGFDFERNEFQDFAFGFKKIDEKYEDKIDVEKLKSNFINSFGKNVYSNNLWPAYTKFIGYENWNDDIFKKIYSGEFAKEICLKVKALVDIISDFGKDKEREIFDEIPQL